MRRKGPFWKVYYGIYWAMAVGLGASIALSVTYRAFETPAQAEPSAALSEAECEHRFMDLYGRLRARATGTFGARSLVEIDNDWQNFSKSWRGDLAKAEADCRVKADPGRKSLRKLSNDIDRMHLAYTTALKGFGDIGRKPLTRIENRRQSN